MDKAQLPRSESEVKYLVLEVTLLDRGYIGCDMTSAAVHTHLPRVAAGSVARRRGAHYAAVDSPLLSLLIQCTE